MYQTTLLRSLSVLWLVLDFVAVAAQSPDAPRWGQAASLVQNTLYIHGGRTDQYNSFAYSSAPVTNDLLTLDLSSSFNVSSPPWKYLSGCSNCSAPQGPAVAWHTLSAFNLSNLLLFGGDPGPNSPIAQPEQPDSAVLLNITSQSQTPSWDYVPQSWANEPLRRIYHSASSSQGRVWIVGGLKADGSGNAFAEHYIFDPTVPYFTQLTAAGGPPDILGHTSIILPNGTLIVFGGMSPSQGSLIPMTTIWAIDTTHPGNNWSTLSVGTGSVPPGRRGFASTLLDGGRVLIHGGADAALQNSFSDGWILDTTQNPMAWTAVDALSQLGPRRDHTAVAMGSSVLFFFGFATNGPASSSVFVFDTSSSSFQPTFTPPPAGSASPTTLPGSSPTSGPGTSPGSGTGQPGNDPGSSSPHSPGSGGGQGPSEGPGDPQNNGSSSNSSHATAIALGTVFGIIGLMLVTTGVAYYIRRKNNSQESFHLLSPNSDDEESPHLGPVIPIVGGTVREKGLPLPPVVRGVKERLTSLVPGRVVKSVPDRRDMLADEDTREFESDWWAGGVLMRDGSTGHSSAKRPTLGDKVYDSLASLRTVGGAMLDYAASATVAKSMRKEGSGGSRSFWRSEKEPSGDPFGDDWGLVRAKRPNAGRQGSEYTYVDPFEDYEVKSIVFDYDAPPYVDEDEEKGYPRLSDPPPRPYMHSAMGPTMDLTRLTPVSEQPSLATLTESGNTPSESSHSNPSSQSLGLFAAASSSSHDTPRSPTRPSSLIDANSHADPPSSPMRRSNSWWVRFAKTPLLDRRSNDAVPRQPLDFRDPHPPPSTRLVPIEEASLSPTDSQSKRGSSGGHHQVWSSHAHGRSASSLQTARTANSEMLERMGQMDVVQKGSHGTDQSSSGGEPGRLPPVGRVERPLSVVTTTSSADSRSIMDDDLARAFVMSPEAMVDPSNTHPMGRSSPPRRSPTGNVVSARVQAFERRMSQQEDSSPPLLKSPPPVRPRNRGSTYGVAPKPSLYVTNPDQKRSGSGDS